VGLARLIRRCGLVTACLLALTPALAAGAVNDDFIDALPLHYGDPDARITTDTGTVEPGETLTSQGGSDRNVCTFADPSIADLQSVATHWWYVVGSGRRVTLSVAGSNFDILAGLFENTINDRQASCAYALVGYTGPLMDFDSRAGALYRVQIGGCWNYDQSGPCGTLTGRVRIVATTPAPGNDARASAPAIATGARVTGDNYGATEEGGEPLACQSERGRVEYGRSVWYRWDAPAAGRAIFSSSGFDTVLSVYRDSSPTPVACNDAADPAAASRAAVDVTPGTYFIQVAGAGRHDPGALSDAQQGSFAAQVEFTETPDRDGDGVINAQDCQPDNPAISPRARDVPQNGVDENCDGKDAPYPKLSSSVRGQATWSFYRSYTKVTGLVALNVPRGARVEVRCRGKSCPARRLLRRTVRRNTARLPLMTRSLRRTQIRPVTTLEVRITRSRTVGRVKSWRFARLRRDPTERNACLPVGGGAARSCARLP
jgi:hypothetical protein